MLSLQWIKRYFDMHFGGHEYNALERRGGGGGGSSSKENSGTASAANPRSATAAAAAASAASTASKNRGTPVRAAARDVSNITGSAPSRPGSSMGKRPGACSRKPVSHLTRHLALLRIHSLSPVSELRPAQLLKLHNGNCLWNLLSMPCDSDRGDVHRRGGADAAVAGGAHLAEAHRRRGVRLSPLSAAHTCTYFTFRTRTLATPE